MHLEGTKKYFTNPMIAMLPAIIYILLQISSVPVPYALGIGLFVAIFIEFLLRRTFQSKIHSLPYYMIEVVFALMILLWIIGHKWIENDYAYFIIGEVGMILQLMALRVGRRFINARFFKERSFLAKALLNDYFTTLVMFKYALIVHVLLLLLYQEIVGDYGSDFVNYIVHVAIPVTFILFFLVYQFLRTRHLIAKLRKEEWIPIINEVGEVKGKIARAVSRKFKNKYMHPVVRVALVCNNKLYLQERDADYIVDPRKLDHPFEKYILFKHEIEEAVQNILRMKLGYLPDREPKFICKYTFKNELTNRLIFLFAAEVDDECQIIKTDKMKGKFWTIKQIEEDFGNQIFSECFELEYEYLKHVVLLEDVDHVLLAKV